MHLKDYYSILAIETSASMMEIKKAYRKLALQYHPDKNHNDPYATAQFTAIKEAYEVLTNPAKKEYYLQQRWYNQSIGKRKSQDIITPVTILMQVVELEKYVSTLDVFRMNKKGLEEYILGLLPDSTIDVLKNFNDPDINRQITTMVIKAMSPLPPGYSGAIMIQLKKLAAGDEKTEMIVAEYIQKKAKKSRREKYSLLLILVITLFLCAIIFLSGR